MTRLLSTTTPLRLVDFAALEQFDQLTWRRIGDDALREQVLGRVAASTSTGARVWCLPRTSGSPLRALPHWSRRSQRQRAELVEVEAMLPVWVGVLLPSASATSDRIPCFTARSAT